MLNTLTRTILILIPCHLFLLLILSSCTGTKTSNSQGLIASASSADTTVESAENIEIINNNDEVPNWALWAMGVGVICFALIIPSPFKLRGS